MISHLTNTVTFMTNSIGESRHVGHSIIRFKLIYFYAVNSPIVQYMYTCIYSTDISNTNNSNQYTYTYMYFSNSIHNQSQSHLSSYHLSMKNISNNNHSNQYIYAHIYISQLAFITDHNHISIPILLSYYLFKDILIHVFTHVYSFLYSFMCAHSYPHLHMHSCKLIHTLIHVYSFTYTHS